jgi:hypothetical protein
VSALETRVEVWCANRRPCTGRWSGLWRDGKRRKKRGNCCISRVSCRRRCLRSALRSLPARCSAIHGRFVLSLSSAAPICRPMHIFRRNIDEFAPCLGARLRWRAAPSAGDGLGTWNRGPFPISSARGETAQGSVETSAKASLDGDLLFCICFSLSTPSPGRRLLLRPSFWTGRYFGRVSLTMSSGEGLTCRPVVVFAAWPGRGAASKDAAPKAARPDTEMKLHPPVGEFQGREVQGGTDRYLAGDPHAVLQ